MPSQDLIRQIIAMYERHGWKLQRVLLRSEMRAAIAAANEIFGGATLHEADFDALWFARPSDGKREAWELRLISEQPYALFEAFEMDETEEDREAARHELENRMRKYAETT